MTVKLGHHYCKIELNMCNKLPIEKGYQKVLWCRFLVSLHSQGTFICNVHSSKISRGELECQIILFVGGG